MTTTPSLRSLLLLDAAACAAMGLGLAIGAEPIAAWTSIDARLLFWSGAALLPVAGVMAMIARRDPVPAWGARIVIAGNLLWAIASLVLPFSGAIAPNPLGWGVLVLQAAAVAGLTLLEIRAASQERIIQ